MNKGLIICLLLASCIVSFAAGTVWERHGDDIRSKIYRQSELNKSSGDWGSIFIYTNDETKTYGTENMLTAVLEFLPGEQLQPPHQHEEEEFSFVISGGGTWSLNGEESEIQEGDLLYAKPWDYHGIKNTSKDTLRFFVVKWNNKNVNRPVAKE